MHNQIITYFFPLYKVSILLKTPENHIQSDYIKRINTVFTYIEKHLNERLSLEVIAQKANFSPFHFHRVFKTIVGETLNEYIIRQRLEYAANTLLHRQNISISELSYKSGFGSNATFSRAFKKAYGMSPSEYHLQMNSNSKISQLDSKNSKTFAEYDQYICNIINLKNWITMNANIEEKKMEQLDLAYITCMGVESISGAFDRLIKWGSLQELTNSSNFRMATIYHDSFITTNPNKVRMSACMVLDKPVKGEGEIGTTAIKAGKTIVSRLEIELSEFEKAWSGLFIWMNDNGYVMTGSNPYEIYYNDYKTHPEQKFIVDICIPVK